MSRSWWLALGAIAIVVLACGATPTPSGAGPSPTLGGSPTAEASPATDVCSIEQPPGPNDDPPRDTGEIPMPDVGGGRFALCLIGTDGARVEGTAWCTWTPDRIAVQEVTGLPTDASDGAMVDVYLDLRSSAIQVAATDAGGSITTYAQTDVPGAIRDDGSDGLMAIDAPLAVGSDPAPAGTLPRQAGTFRWQCAGPPPA